MYVAVITKNIQRDESEAIFSAESIEIVLLPWGIMARSEKIIF